MFYYKLQLFTSEEMKETVSNVEKQNGIAHFPT